MEKEVCVEGEGCDPQELISLKERRGEAPAYMTTNGESRHQLSLAYVSPILSFYASVCMCVCDCAISVRPVSLTEQTLTLCNQAGKRYRRGGVVQDTMLQTVRTVQDIPFF